MSDSHERKLIVGLKDSSQSAFDAIYNMYFKRIYSFCCAYVKSSVKAEEIVQDVFVRLWNSRKSIRNEDSLKSLIFTIARNLTINAFRSTINSPLFEECLAYNESLAANDEADYRVQYDDMLNRILEIISKMPKTRRECMVMSKLKCMRNKEIADILSLSEQTVKNQLTHGMKTLRAELEKLSPCILLIFVLLGNIL